MDEEQLMFRASLQDDATPGLRNIQRETKNLASGMQQSGKRAAQSLDPVQQQIKKTESATSRFAGAVKGNMGKIAAAFTGLYAIRKVTQFFKSAFSAGAKLETTRKTLTGLYNDAELAGKTLTSLGNVAKDSPLDFSAYQDAASSLAYAGVQGEQAVTILKNVGLAITAAGGDSQNLSRASAAILKMVNLGKVNLVTLNQLSAAGAPVISGLAERLSVPIESVNKMASAGQIKLDDVLAVMENATGDTFQSMLVAGEEASKSFGNQWLKAKDAIVQAVGEKLVPALESLGPAIGAASGFITDGLIPAVAGFVSILGRIPGPIKLIVGAFVGLALAKKIGLVGKLGGAMETMSLHAMEAGGSIKGFKTSMSGLAKAIGPALGIALAVKAVSALKESWDLASKTLLDVNELIDENTGLLKENADELLEASLAPFVDDLSKAGIGMDQTISAIKNGGPELEAVSKKLDDSTGWWESRFSSIWKNPISPEFNAAKNEIVNTSKELDATLKAEAESKRLAAEATRNAAIADGTYRDSQDESKKSAVELAKAYRMVPGPMDDAKTQAEITRLSFLGMNQATDDIKRTQLEAHLAIVQTNDSAKESAAAMDGMREGFQKIDDAASEANDRLRAFSGIVDKIAGIDRTAKEQALEHAQAVLDIAEAMTKATEATDGHLESLIADNGEIKTRTQEGIDLAKSVDSYRKTYDEASESAIEMAVNNGDAAGAMDAMRAAADDSRQTFLDQAAAAGINEKAALRMADAAGILEGKKLTDKQFEMIMDGMDFTQDQIDIIERQKLSDKRVDISAEDRASGVVAQIKMDILGLKGKTVTIRTIHDNIVNNTTYTRDRRALNYPSAAAPSGGRPGQQQEAMGHIVQAAQGLIRKPMMAPGGSNILWAEPETGWEAYIPGSAKHRGRAESLLAEVADRFGGAYLPAQAQAQPQPAAAGLITGGGTTNRAGQTMTVEVNVDARGQDSPDAIGNSVGEQVRQQIMEVLRNDQERSL